MMKEPRVVTGQQLADWIERGFSSPALVFRRTVIFEHAGPFLYHASSLAGALVGKTRRIRPAYRMYRREIAGGTAERAALAKLLGVPPAAVHEILTLEALGRRTDHRLVMEVLRRGELSLPRA